jgi:competence protein CoiA
MRFALAEGVRSEARPKQHGCCPLCGPEMIPKCGRVKVWHWAHKGRLECDPWYEETEWHRLWKNRFPLEWQEQIAYDPESGEKHIADVRTPSDLVIEFQHSVISPQEVAAREAFYKKMIWIVDGDRGSLDPQYFSMGLHGPISRDPLAYGVEFWGRSRLLPNWSAVAAPVYLDFGESVVWRLISFQAPRNAIVLMIPKDGFVERCMAGEALSAAMVAEGVEAWVPRLGRVQRDE